MKRKVTNSDCYIMSSKKNPNNFMLAQLAKLSTCLKADYYFVREQKKVMGMIPEADRASMELQQLPLVSSRI